ncbi:hypothetical protein CsSME_00006303 [Camellia sinensis var. sinensis]
MHVNGWIFLLYVDFTREYDAQSIIVVAIWGLGPLMRQGRSVFFHKNDSSWKKSGTVLDPMVLPSEASEIVKQRLLNFIRSLSTVLALAYCLSRWRTLYTLATSSAWDSGIFHNLGSDKMHDHWSMILVTKTTRLLMGSSTQSTYEQEEIFQ